jgi:hypothetical protein
MPRRRGKCLDCGDVGAAAVGQDPPDPDPMTAVVGDGAAGAPASGRRPSDSRGSSHARQRLVRTLERDQRRAELSLSRRDVGVRVQVGIVVDAVSRFAPASL